MATDSFNDPMVLETEEQLSSLCIAMNKAMNNPKPKEDSDILDELKNNALRLKELHNL